MESLHKRVRNVTAPRTGMLAAVSRPGVIAAGILALLAGTFVLVGILLPTTVEVTRERWKSRCSARGRLSLFST